MSRQRGADGAAVDRPGVADAAAEEQVAAVLEATLARAREHDYRGWGVDDVEESRLLGAVPGEQAGLRRVVGGVARRSPRDLRPLLRVERRRGDRSAALLASACQTLAWLHDHSPTAIGGDGVDHRSEARELLAWLADRVDDAAGDAAADDGDDRAGDGGGTPTGDGGDGDGGSDARSGRSRGVGEDVAATAPVVEALFRGKYVDRRFAEVGLSAATALFDGHDLRPLATGEAGADALDAGAVDVTTAAQAARVLVVVHDHTGDAPPARGAGRLLDAVAAAQSTRGTWLDRSPPGGRRRWPASVHTGTVLAALQRYAAVVDAGRHRDAREDGLDAYRRLLFEPDGAPRAAPGTAYPRDARAAAQGALVFTGAGDFQLARRVLEWALEHLHVGDGRFRYRRHRLHDKHHLLLRSCGAWLAYALAEYLRCRYVDRGPGRQVG